MAYGGGPPRRMQVDFGLSGPIPRDILLLMGLTFASFTLGAFGGTKMLVAMAQVTPLIWTSGALWQLVTYPFATSYGIGALGLILSLWMMLMFGKQVFAFVGRKFFWRYFFTTAVIASVAAVLTQLLLGLLGFGGAVPQPFALMNGQFFILAFLITGYAALYGNATVLLMFVLPVKASWFVGIEIALAFLAFLGYQDFAGFVGICTAVGVSYFQFSGRGPARFIHEMRMRLERRWLEYKLRRLSKKGGGSGDGGVIQGPWVN